MISIRNVAHDDGTMVFIKGDATIHHAQELHTALVSLSKESSTLILQTKDVYQLDLSFVQILASCCLSFQRDHKKILITRDDISPILLKALSITGIFCHPSIHQVEEDTCMFAQVRNLILESF